MLISTGCWKPNWTGLKHRRWKKAASNQYLRRNSGNGKMHLSKHSWSVHFYLQIRNQYLERENLSSLKWSKYLKFKYAIWFRIVLCPTTCILRFRADLDLSVCLKSLHSTFVERIDSYCSTTPWTSILIHGLEAHWKFKSLDVHNLTAVKTVQQLERGVCLLFKIPDWTFFGPISSKAAEVTRTNNEVDPS